MVRRTPATPKPIKTRKKAPAGPSGNTVAGNAGNAGNANAGVNRLDVAYVIDSTGSMQPFLDAAKKYLIDITTELAKQNNVDFASGISVYRDYCDSPTVETFPLTTSTSETQGILASLRAHGGGDNPEAVYAGMSDAITKLAWRDHSQRFIILVGDAPPHAYQAWHYKFRYEDLRYFSHDDFKDACKSGLDPLMVAAMAEAKGIVVHAVVMGPSVITFEAFKSISSPTGGSVLTAANARQVIQHITGNVTKEILTLDFDRQIYNLLRAHPMIDVETKEGMLKFNDLCLGTFGTAVTERQIATSVANLGRRGLYSTSES